MPRRAIQPHNFAVSDLHDVLWKAGIRASLSTDVISGNSIRYKTCHPEALLLREGSPAMLGT